LKHLRYDDLDRADRELVDAARTATATAYAPYSGALVGAALRTADGTVVAASNLENAAYGSTICAERMAVGRANAMGHRTFAAVAIAAMGAALRPDRVVSPCGACRQVLHEMASAAAHPMRVIMTAPGADAITVATLDELLPLAFEALTR